MTAFEMRVAIHDWLWSGGKVRTFAARHLPMYVSDPYYEGLVDVTGTIDDPWQEHFDNTGHSAGQVNDFYYCVYCDWTHGNRSSYS